MKQSGHLNPSEETVTSKNARTPPCLFGVGRQQQYSSVQVSHVYRKIYITRQHIRRVFDLRMMLRSLQTVSDLTMLMWLERFWQALRACNNNNNNVYLMSNIQTSSMECTYKLIKDKKKYVPFFIDDCTYLKLCTSRVCPDFWPFVAPPLLLFVLCFVFSPLISIPYSFDVLSILLTRCRGSVRQCHPHSQVGQLSALYANSNDMSIQHVVMIRSKKEIE